MPGIHPTYQVTCELQLESWIPAQFADLDCDYRFSPTARYDMAFQLNTDLWDHLSGYRQIDQVLEILAAAAAGPRIQIAELV